MTKEFAGISVAVTGATGLIGGGVARELLNRGAQVRALVRNPAKAKDLLARGADIRLLDFSNRTSLEDALCGCKLVFHFAAVLNEFKAVSYYRRINVDGTRAIAEAALATRVQRFIYASTVWVFGDRGYNLDESSPLRSNGTPYTDTKVEAEHLIRSLAKERGLPAITIYPSEVYGAGDQTWTIRPFELLRTGKMLLVDGGRGLIQPIYVDDLVEGILLAATKGSVGQSYILCGDDVLPLADYFSPLARMANRKRLPSVPGWLALTVAGAAELAACVFRIPPAFTRQEARATMIHATYHGGRARRELGFAPKVQLAEGMQRVEEWLRSCGRL